MTQPYAIGDWKTHLGTAGHKEGILAREEQERREALGDDIPNDGKQQQLTLARFSLRNEQDQGLLGQYQKRRSVGGQRQKQSAGSQWRLWKWQYMRQRWDMQRNYECH